MRRLLAPLLLCLLFAAGCGDDEDTTGGDAGSTTAATTSTTPAETAAADEQGCTTAEKPKPKSDRFKKPTVSPDRTKSLIAVLDTSCGTIEIALDSKRAPKTVASFVFLARKGFFDGLSFHRIVPGFVVQGGDPKGNGSGGPGYKVVEAPPESLKYTRGIVAMAKTELEKPGTSGSQFFIVTAPNVTQSAGLTPDYALVGEVKKGDEALTKLSEVPADPSDGTPERPVLIDKVTINEG